MRSFRNKNVMITGAAQGIGQALAIEFANRGANIIACDILPGDATVAAIQSSGVQHMFESVDMRDRNAIDGFIANAIDTFETIDVLINNAGIALGDRTFQEVTIEDFEAITDINYWGVVYTTRKLYDHLLSRPEAAIVNLSSTQGILASPYLIPYCTTKFAVRGFTDALRHEHKLRDINHVSVHTVHPGAVATNITTNAQYHNTNTEMFHKLLQKGLPPSGAAKTIAEGVIKNKGRIFVSDGKFQDIIARLFPSHIHLFVKLQMKHMGAKIR